MHAAPADDGHVQRQAFVLRLGKQPVFRQGDLQVEGPVTVATQNRAGAFGSILPFARPVADVD